MLEALKQRRSVREYEDEEVSQDTILKILDAARFAPTARNLQPWKFLVVKDKNKIRRLAELASPNGSFIEGAKCLILVFCEDTKYYLEDGSSVTVYIMLAAQTQGLGSCWVAGDKKPYCSKIKSLLNAPSEYKLVSIVSLGYPKHIPTKEKKPLEKILLWEEWH